MLGYKRVAVPVLDVSRSTYQTVQMLMDLSREQTTNGWFFLTGSLTSLAGCGIINFLVLKKQRNFSMNLPVGKFMKGTKRRPLYILLTYPMAGLVHQGLWWMMSPKQRTVFSLISKLEETLKGWNCVWQKTLMQDKWFFN